MLLNRNKKMFVGLLLGLFTMPAIQANTTLLGVSELYQKAQKHDARLAQAYYQLSETLQNKPALESALMPKIAAKAGANIQRHSEDLHDLNTATIGVDLVQPLYNAKTHTQLKQVDKQLQQAELGYRQAQQDLILRLVGDYFKVLTTQGDMALIDTKQKADALQYDRTAISTEAGLSNRTDLLEAKSNLDLTLAEQITTRNTFENALENLENLIGQSLFSLKALEKKSQLPREKVDLDGALAKGMQQNLSVLSSQLQVDIAQDEVALTKQTNAPQVNLTLGASYNEYDNVSPMMASQFQDRSTLSLGVNASMPLYDGGLEKAKVSQARYAVKKTIEAFRQAKEEVTLSIKQSVRNIKRSQAHVDALWQAKKSTEAFLEATETSYESGLRDLVDVLNARTGLLSAERNLITAQYQLLAEKLKLKALTNELGEEDLIALDRLLTKHIALK